MRIIHWFRNDLRLRDNTALSMAAARADEILPVFIVDPRLLQRHAAANRLVQLARSLDSLSDDLTAAGCPLLLITGHPEAVIPRLAAELRADLVTCNRDYSPYAERRDRAVNAALVRAGSQFESCKDRVVFEAREIVTLGGSPYRVYTPYRNAWIAQLTRSPPAPAPIPRLPRRCPTPDIVTAKASVIASGQSSHAAGEAAAAARLGEFLGGPLARYSVDRDRPDLEGTSRLSAALRFGSISIRSCVAGALERQRSAEFADGATKWLDELIWRDFYQALLAEHPHVLSGPFQSRYRDIEWNDDSAGFAAWCKGETGFPFVDAAMRQLVQTGWMHNRARMVVASFLVKDLLIDWRLGERFFMQHLVDGDPAANNGGWQWAASTGTDAQPYFRIFNPVAQGRRYDPDGTYVRRFIPELQGTPKRFIHEPWKSPAPPDSYPPPIVDHAERRLSAIARFAAARQDTPQ